MPVIVDGDDSTLSIYLMAEAASHVLAVSIALNSKMAWWGAQMVQG
jgi:hypothetical protein